MKLSAKAEYACLAVLDLALRRDKQEPVRVADVAERNHIPERFLVQILLQLKGAGFVQSVRGAAGGYNLAVDPNAVNLLDVIQLVDGPNGLATADELAHAGVARSALYTVWQEVNGTEEALLKRTTFARLVELANRQNANMFYI
jgi:Rrf2 family cysteine metabolism transcriptional repressor